MHLKIIHRRFTQILRSTETNVKRVFKVHSDLLISLLANIAKQVEWSMLLP